MNQCLQARKPIYPLFAIHLSITILVFGMLLAKTNRYISYFLLSLFLLFFVIGYHKACLGVLPFMLILGLAFILPKLLKSPIEIDKTLTSSARILSFTVSVIPTLGIIPIDLVRAMRELKLSKKLILASLIIFNFFPLVRGEIKNCRLAVKTRATKKYTSPNILYRAYLIPFITNLIRISEVISMSVETRGFSLSKTKDTIYKFPRLGFKDLLIYLFFLIEGVVVVLYGHGSFN